MNEQKIEWQINSNTQWIQYLYQKIQHLEQITQWQQERINSLTKQNDSKR